MSFKDKLSCFSKNSNREKESKNWQPKNNNNYPDILKKSLNSRSNQIKDSFRNKVNNVVRLSRIFNKNSNIAPELENLNTLEKIIQLQEDLKIVASIKQQFEGNQKKIIEKMNKFCSNYYNNKITMKKIFDYCSNNDAELNFDYNLLTTEQAKNLLKDRYNDLYDFIFLIRNDNKLMLHLIDNSEKEGYEDISDFLVNFCYEDTINSSFIQEDMLIVIYLLVEKCIIKVMPEFDEKTKNAQNEINMYDKYINNNILYYIFLSLTRKADIRSYLCSILPENIIRVENYRSPLSVEIGIITDYLNSLDERKRLLAENRNSTLKPANYKGNIGYLKRLSASTSNFLDSRQTMSSGKKLKSRLTLQNPAFLDNLMQKMDNEKTPNKESEKTLTSENEKTPNNKSNFNFKKSHQSEKKLNTLINNDLKLEENKSTRNETGCEIDIIEVEEEELNNDDDIDNPNHFDDPFFINTDTTKEYIKNKLKEYEEKPNSKNINHLNAFNSNTITAMKDYLKQLIHEFDNEDIKIEKYSNMILINSLNAAKNIKTTDYFNLLVDTIKTNHQIIIEVITELLNIIKDNSHSLPFFIKCISNSIDFLLNYKYKNNLTLYTKYMIKANFFLGNIILPVLENPSYNGIITSEIISNLTKENLEIICSILKMAISGKLFNIGINPCMTIFNQFIIEILPNIFEIVQILEQNFKLPELIKGLTETIKDIDNEEREINYDYFSENNDDKFHFQSICFSYNNLRNILKAVVKYKKQLDVKEKNINKEKNTGKGKEVKDKKYEENVKKANLKKEIIEKNIKNERFFNILFNKMDKKKNYKEYIYMSKMSFLPSFENKIKSILKDNFIGLNPPIKEKFKEEEVSRFKKCLAEVLTYVNLIHKEYIPNFIHIKKENYIHDQDLIDLLVKHRNLNNYKNIMNEELYENININNKLEDEENEDPDFKTEILPYILLNVKSELGSRSTDYIYQRMLYCCSYLQLHIELLPKEYIVNNYKLLFIELIKDTESSINILRNNILNQLNIKVKGSEKTNMIISNTYQQIKNMEKLKCIEYLYSKLEIPSKFIVVYSLNKGLIKNVTYDENSQKLPLSSLFESLPDYRKYENEIEDIVDLEERTNMGESLKNYFKYLKNVIRKENIVKKYSKDDIENICNDLENYILVKLYEKLFPSKSTKNDIKFYNKCCRLDFIKPENLIKDKNMVNENLWKASMSYINEMDNKYTPADKIKSIAKAFSILQNSIAFCSGKNELGVDDTIKPLIYILLKAKPKNIFSNFNYCQLYLDPDLSKKQYGILLTQICMIMNIIKDMKHSELFDVTEEQFGKDEE